MARVGCACRDQRPSLRTRVPPEYRIFASCLRDGQAVAQGARIADQSAGIADRTNRAWIGIFQQQSFLVGVSSADRTDTHGLSKDLFAVDGRRRTTKRIVPALDS